MDVGFLCDDNPRNSDDPLPWEVVPRGRDVPAEFLDRERRFATAEEARAIAAEWCRELSAQEEGEQTPEVVSSAKLADVTTSGVYSCPVNGAPCEVVALIVEELARELQMSMMNNRREFHALPPGELRDKIAETLKEPAGWLPCGSCRRAEKDAPGLAGLRLGSRARAVLLQAPTWDEESAIIEPEQPGRAGSEATRRAILKLCRAGLVWPGWQSQERKVRDPRLERSWYEDGQWWERKPEYQKRTTTVHRRAVWLTPLGGAVVNHIRGQLAAGQRVRWCEVTAPALADCRERPQELLGHWSGKVGRETEYLLKLAGLLVQCPTDAARKYLDQAGPYMTVQRAIRATGLVPAEVAA